MPSATSSDDIGCERRQSEDVAKRHVRTFVASFIWYLANFSLFCRWKMRLLLLPPPTPSMMALADTSLFAAFFFSVGARRRSLALMMLAIWRLRCRSSSYSWRASVMPSLSRSAAGSRRVDGPRDKDGPRDEEASMPPSCEEENALSRPPPMLPSDGPRIDACDHTWLAVGGGWWVG